MEVDQNNSGTPILQTHPDDTSTQPRQKSHSMLLAVTVGLFIMIPLCFGSFVLGRQSVRNQFLKNPTPTEYPVQLTPADVSLIPSIQPTQTEPIVITEIPLVTTAYPSSGPIVTRKPKPSRCESDSECGGGCDRCQDNRCVNMCNDEP